MNDFIKQKYDELTGITYKFLQERNLDKNKYWYWDYLLAADEAEDKQEFQTALSQNMDDLKKVIMDFYAYCCKEKIFDDFVTCFAMYCNHYIKYGLTCLSEDTEDTMFGLWKTDFTNSDDETLLPYLEEIWLGIKTQQYSHFENALSINNNFSVAHLYLFTQKAEIYFWFVEYMDKIQNCPLNLYRNVIFKLGEGGFEFFSPVYDSPNESVQEKLTEINNILDNMDASYENYYHITSVPTDLLNDFCKITSEYADKIKKFIINSYHNFKSQNKQTDFLIFFCQCLRKINSFASGIETDLNPLLFLLFRSYFLFVRNMEDFKQTINVNDNELICHITENDFDASDFSILKLFTFIVSDETFQIWIKLNACSEKTKKEILQEIHQYSNSPEEKFKAKIRDRYYSNMIQHYKQLSPSYQEYALSLGKYYQDNISSTTGRGANSPFSNLNALPHIYFRDWTDVLSEHIVNLSETFDKKYTLTYPEEKTKDLETITEKVENGISLTEEEQNISLEFANQNAEFTAAFPKFTIDLDKAIERMKKSMQNVPDITIKSPFDFHAKEMGDRVHYLNLYRMVHFGTGQQELKELFDISMRLEQRNNELIQVQNDRKQIVNDFSHTFSQMETTTLNDIGTALLEADGEAFHYYGRLVLAEYSIKENLKREIQLLKLRFEDKIQDLLSNIRTTTVYSTTCKDTVTIEDIISDAWKRCFMTLLYDESSKGTDWCNLFFGTENHIEIKESTKEDFEESVLVKENGRYSTSAWLKDKNIINFHHPVSGLWEKMYFKSDNYAMLILTDWISEMFTNVIRYADRKQPVTIAFSSCEEIVHIQLRNEKNPAAKHHNTQIGLRSMRSYVKKLNESVGFKGESMTITNSESSYKLDIYLNKKIFIEGI